LPRLPSEGSEAVSVVAVDLPEHVAEADEWKAWPRKADAHLKWGVRQRQVEAFLRTSKLKLYSCPDGSRRLDPDALRGLFGEPDVLQGKERDLSAAERRARQVEATAATAADPVAFMFGKTVSMMEQLHGQLIGFSKVVTDPMKALLDAYQAANAALLARVKELEARSDQADRLRSELADATQMRDLEMKRAENAERRRDETLQLLKDQIPGLAKVWLEGNTLAEFAKRTPKQAIEVILESGAVSEQDAEIMRRASGIPKPAPETPTSTSNGVTDHGHS
jgi:hypothetical protein